MSRNPGQNARRWRRPNRDNGHRNRAGPLRHRHCPAPRHRPPDSSRSPRGRPVGQLQCGPGPQKLVAGIAPAAVVKQIASPGEDRREIPPPPAPSRRREAGAAAACSEFFRLRSILMTDKDNISRAQSQILQADFAHGNVRLKKRHFRPNHDLNRTAAGNDLLPRGAADNPDRQQIGRTGFRSVRPAKHTRSAATAASGPDVAAKFFFSASRRHQNHDPVAGTQHGLHRRGVDVVATDRTGAEVMPRAVVERFRASGRRCFTPHGRVPPVRRHTLCAARRKAAS